MRFSFCKGSGFRAHTYDPRPTSPPIGTSPVTKVSQGDASTHLIEQERITKSALPKPATNHLATFTLKVTVLGPPAFVMTNLYCASFAGVTLTEHFGPGESSLATCAPEES